MKSKIFFLLVISSISYAEIVSNAIDKKSSSQKNLTDNIESQNTAHKNYINLNKNILLSKNGNIFLTHQRSELILNQHKIRGIKGE
ncbi:hypothetical protein CFVI97532_06980 [Campylobacter fetus subsp. venerealis cfvi97/532]|nr:hypothetical protein CFVI97532_06980 [Campylobacter fetus subsp. venerealis cfvi97/532]